MDLGIRRRDCVGDNSLFGCYKQTHSLPLIETCRFGHIQPTSPSADEVTWSILHSDAIVLISATRHSGSAFPSQFPAAQVRVVVVVVVVSPFPLLALRRKRKRGHIGLACSGSQLISE